MSGALDSDRRQPPVRQVAVCHRCGHERDGETRFETMAYGFRHPVGRAIHFCDECDHELLADERPLEEVLMDYLDPSG
jgi:hypothetical protein